MARLHLHILCVLVTCFALSSLFLRYRYSFPSEEVAQDANSNADETTKEDKQENVNDGSTGCNGAVDPEDVKPGLEAFDQRKGDPSTIHIAFIFDERGRKMVVGAIRSVLATTEHPVEFHLVCSPGEDKEIVEKFGNAGPRAGQLHFYEYSGCKAFFDKVGHLMGRSNPMMNICRMMLPDILPASLERVLYMDADLTVVRDLGPIFHAEFNEDQMIGQSMDTYGRIQHHTGQWPRAYEVKTADGLKCGTMPHVFSEKDGGHRNRCKNNSKGGFERMQFNAGVGVYDLNKFRERNFTSTIAEYIEAGYKMAKNRIAEEPTQDSMNSYYRRHPKVSKVLPCGANYQFRSEWKTVYCANKDVYIAHSYNPGTNARIEDSAYGKRMIYFWGECTDCCGMPDVPLTSNIDKKMDFSGLKPLFRYTAGCPHQPSYECTNGIESLNGFVLDSSLH
ncbi:hypothetical protein BSKO_01210 [Bryopsis sp. KO-2023]|nr:hypothetical protein BSKO_01210 [Bryopsis sp. KO-2023]